MRILPGRRVGRTKIEWISPEKEHKELEYEHFPEGNFLIRFESAVTLCPYAVSVMRINLVKEAKIGLKRGMVPDSRSAYAEVTAGD